MYRVKYYYYLFQKEVCNSYQTRCGSSMGRFEGFGKNGTKQGVNWIRSFVETNKHTNIILMEVPHRHDLIQDSCVNKEVEKFNSIIRKHMKVHENAEVVKVTLDRRASTKYGQHMNAMGKN
jgi:hypothetical protein